MINPGDIITLILAGTTFTPAQVVRAKENEDNFQVPASLPMIYVGWGGVSSLHPEIPLAKNVFNMNGENLVQAFDIRIVDLEDNFNVTWKAVYKSLIGKNPQPLERMHTALTYSQGGKMAISNGKLWWVDRWWIGFPTLYTNF